MTDREMVSVRLEKDTKNRVEQYAEKHDVSRSTAIRRLLEKGADLEDAGIAVAASQVNDDPEPMADGSGAVVRPFLQTVTGISAFTVLLSFLYGLVVVSTGIPPIIGVIDTIGILVSSSVTLVLFLIPQYTRIPEKVDSHLWNSARNIAPSITEP